MKVACQFYNQRLGGLHLLKKQFSIAKMASKLFVIDSGNLEATNTSVQDVLDKLKLTDYKIVSFFRLLKWTNSSDLLCLLFQFIGRNFNIGQDSLRLSFNSILDLTLFMARKLKLLKNERVLFLNEEESYQTIALILRKLYKDETGDDDFPVSEVLEVNR